MKTLKIKINGTVQGVFFRKFIKEQADKLNIRGFIRNLENGDVEAVIEGKDENINQMLELCKNGSPHSEIKSVECEEIKHQGLDGFKILRL